MAAAIRQPIAISLVPSRASSGAAMAALGNSGQMLWTVGVLEAQARRCLQAHLVPRVHPLWAELRRGRLARTLRYRPEASRGRGDQRRLAVVGFPGRCGHPYMATDSVRVLILTDRAPSY